jgi:magnesium transporter
MSVDCAYYEHGMRQARDGMSIADAAGLPRRGSNYVWIELDDPSKEVMNDLCRHFGLHELAVEDAGRAHQRPKVEAYDDFYFLVFRTAQFEEASGTVTFGELDLFIGAGYVIAVRHGAAGNPIRTRMRVEQYPDLLKRGPAAVVWGILDVVVDDYAPVIDALETEIEAVERAIFDQEEEATERIYYLKQQLNEVYRALHPLLAPLDALERGDAFPEMHTALRRYFRDISDHVRRAQDEVLSQREQLANVLDAHLSLLTHRQNQASIRQNRTIQQLTVVATIFLPLTFITGFFGQNFRWLVVNIDSLSAFLIAGIGSLVVPCLIAFAWLTLRRRSDARASARLASAGR